MNEAKWDELNCQQQWKALSNHKDSSRNSVVIFLEKDKTAIEWTNSDDTVLKLSLRNTIGDRYGVMDLLEHLGFLVSKP